MTPDEALAALDQQVVPGYARTLNVDAHGEPVAVDPAAAGLTPVVAPVVEPVAPAPAAKKAPTKSKGKLPLNSSSSK